MLRGRLPYGGLPRSFFVSAAGFHFLLSLSVCSDRRNGGNLFYNGGFQNGDSLTCKSGRRWRCYNTNGGSSNEYNLYTFPAQELLYES